MGEEVINVKFVRSGRLYTDSLGQASRRLGSEAEDSGTDAHNKNYPRGSKASIRTSLAWTWPPLSVSVRLMNSLILSQSNLTSADSASVSEAESAFSTGLSERQHYAALYAMPGAIRAGFAQFAAFGQDALDSKAYLAKGKLTMPVLAIGGEAAFGTMMATVMRFAATDVQEAIVPASGHWIMEENPAATTKLVPNFLKS